MPGAGQREVLAGNHSRAGQYQQVRISIGAALGFNCTTCVLIPNRDNGTDTAFILVG